MNQENPEQKIDTLKANFSLCIQILESICDDAGIDMEKTSFKIQIGKQEASLIVSEMILKWKQQCE